MKKNLLMWVLTVVVAFIGVLIAIISFFKNKRFFWCFKNEKDVIPEKDEAMHDETKALDCNCNSENCDECEQVACEHVSVEENGKLEV